MRSESKKQLIEIQKNVISPITHTIAFKTPDEVMEAALDCFWRQLKQKKLL